MHTLIRLTAAHGHDDAYRKIQATLAAAGLPPTSGYAFDASVGKHGAFVSNRPQVIAAFGEKHGTADKGSSDDAA